jgi:sec-independent protein translocase protein TatA
MFDVGGGELIVVLLFILLLFGPKKIPEFAQMVGKGLRKFRMAQEELTQQIRDISAEAAINDDDFKKKASAAPAIDVTQPIVVPKPADDTVARPTNVRTAADSASTASDNENAPPLDREGSPS